ncbi:hypothetical protein LCGC14_1862120 [marine sediment metagenome]|uniref:Uncharacterized protein n=1 Tax=marine sediment metagenome TaxID=412755 RepID=A0A0F9ILM0_9ZZZZ
MRVTVRARAIASLLPWPFGLCHGADPPSAKGQSVEELTRQLRSGDSKLRMEAVNCLAGEGSGWGVCHTGLTQHTAGCRR